MNRLALIVATGLLTLTLTGCGENGGSKPTAEPTESTASQPADQTQAPATENNAAAPQQDPAEGQSH